MQLYKVRISYIEYGLIRQKHKQYIICEAENYQLNDLINFEVVSVIPESISYTKSLYGITHIEPLQNGKKIVSLEEIQ